jgi:hypothetical protein
MSNCNYHDVFCLLLLHFLTEITLVILCNRQWDFIMNVYLVKLPREFKSFYMDLNPEDQSYVLGFYYECIPSQVTSRI